MDLNELLKKFSRVSAPAGYEKPMAELAVQLLEPFCGEVRTDVMGSVIATRRCGREGAKTVMLDAHIDEIGFVITGNDGGFLRFAAMGVDARMLPASKIKILTEPPIYGVVDVMPPHLLKDGEGEKTIKIEDLYIDTGLSAEDAAAIPVGTAAVYASEPVELGGRLLSAKAMDDRACFAAILRALELLGDTQLGYDLVVLGSVQEEVGTRGARPAGFAVAPDFCIVTDVDFGLAPDSKPHQGKALGSGAVISYGPNMNRAFTDKIVAIAKARELKHSISIEPGGNSGTNAHAIQIARGGVATALLGVPLRYMHTPGETLDVADVESLAQLICAVLKECDFDA